MRKVLKWLTAGVAGLVVAVGGYGVWDTYSNYREELAGYKGVRWGDSQAEVRYALGMPTNVHYKEQPGDPGYDELMIIVVLLLVAN